jgi:hypothetical protein
VVPVAGWSVFLTGPPHELEVLAHVPALGWQVTKQDAEYVLRSDRFETFELDRAADVLASASEIVDIVNGVIALEGWGNGEVKATSPSFLAPDGSRHAFAYVAEGVGTVDRVTVSGTDPYLQFGLIAQLAMMDPAVYRAMIFMKTRTWPGLYNAVEEMETAVGSRRALADLGGISAAKIGTLTRTANSFATVGAGARHPPGKTEPPRNPMTLEEASQIVTALLAAWVRSKVSEVQ